MPKRRLPLGHITLCIVLGAVTTWLVAWVAGASDWAGWQPARPRAQSSEFAYDQQRLIERERFVYVASTTDLWSISRYDAVSHEGLNNLIKLRALVPADTRESLPSPPAQQNSDGNRFVQGISITGYHPALRESLATDYLTSLPGRREETGATRTRMVQSSFGWPARALTSLRVREGANTSEVQYGAFTLRAFTRPIAKGPPLHPTFPFLPIWPGLLLNTAFYAALWSLPLFTLPLLKQRRRKRRGHCARCNYDLKGAFDHGCPECGWKRPSIPDP